MAGDVAAIIDLFSIMCIIHTMTSAEIIRKLKDDGWVQVRVSGSHHHFKHSIKKGLVTVPHPKSSIPMGTLKSILKQAGLK